MDASLQAETEALRRAWDRHEATFLRDYLVAGVEDPRFNVQSVLTRHGLLGLVFGDRFAALRGQELPFAAALNWLLAQQAELAEPEGRAALRYGLERDAENVEGLVIPRFLRALWRTLPVVADGVTVPNYLAEILAAPPSTVAEASATDTFSRLWTACLAAEPTPATPLAVLELACGSANDYRALAASGLTRFLAYTGLDLSAKNIANAQAQFPGARFLEGNVLAIPAADRAFDCVFAHDLFEHLSPAALPVAVAECCRVARRAACLGCFSAAEVPDHVIRPTGDYHWNTLSVERMLALFEAQGFTAQVIHIGTFLKWLTGDGTTHNPNAYTFVLQAAGPDERGEQAEITTR